MLATNSLDFALEHFGPAIEPELYAAIDVASEADLERFLEAYRAFAASAQSHPPTLGPSELRPYLSYGGHPDWSMGGLQLDFQTLKDEGAEWRIVDGVKHRLLYCHSIALDDPLGHLLALTTAEMRAKQGQGGKDALLRFVNLLLHFAPLLRRNIVCLLPNRVYSSNRSRSRDELEAALSESGVTYDASEVVNAAPEVLRAMWKADSSESHRKILSEVARKMACQRLASGLEAVMEAPQRLSLYLPFRADVDFIAQNSRLGGKTTLAGFSDRDNWLLQQLIDLEMPGINELDLAALVDIRGGPEFGEWRRALATALQAASALPTNLWERDCEVHRAVRDALSEGQRHLEAGLAKSQVLSGLRKGRTSVIIGLVSLGVSALFDPTKLSTAAILSLLAGSTIAAAISALETGQPSARTNAALAYYIAALR